MGEWVYIEGVNVIFIKLSRNKIVPGYLEAHNNHIEGIYSLVQLLFQYMLNNKHVHTPWFSQEYVIHLNRLYSSKTSECDQFHPLLLVMPGEVVTWTFYWLFLKTRIFFAGIFNISDKFSVPYTGIPYRCSFIFLFYLLRQWK